MRFEDHRTGPMTHFVWLFSSIRRRCCIQPGGRCLLHMVWFLSCKFSLGGRDDSGERFEVLESSNFSDDTKPCGTGACA